MTNEPPVPSAWQVMDDWCREQSRKLLAQTDPHILKGRDLNDPRYRLLLGQSQAYGKMRSFIHGGRNALATEAGTAETVEQGSVHEGAGRDSDNAQGSSQ